MFRLCTRRNLFTTCRLAKVVFVFCVLLACLHLRKYPHYTEVSHVDDIGAFDKLVKPSKIQSIPDIVFSRKVGLHQQVHSFEERQAVREINNFQNNFKQQTSVVPKLPKELTLLIVVCSHPSHVHLRQTIRNTWAEGGKDNSSVRVIFLTGKANTWTEIIRRENILHQDILQIDVIESYRNLSNKLIEGMEWISRNVPSAKFYMKCDDDVFINISYLLALLANRIIDQHEILGAFSSGAKVIRDPRDAWSVPFAKYRLPTFPPYVTGGAYVMTMAALKSLLRAAVTTPSIHLEDVYITGMLAARANISHVDSSGFSYWMSPKAKPCDIVTNRRIVSVNMAEKDIFQLHERVQVLISTNTTFSCNSV
ncbi:beta-1,3-galactosyltransferase 5-like [Gigantopelta aegis]|uniref:beta-1,3-galactosyltransferase 5-like n=1 Tax=Gigantopelta aegis TaxID=1735272 RepID=UPI001B88CF8B|nr:beta-1,3-galactosyltransferase 5-like [Gigantopelta aegis]